MGYTLDNTKTNFNLLDITATNFEKTLEELGRKGILSADEIEELKNAIRQVD